MEIPVRVRPLIFGGIIASALTALPLAQQPRPRPPSVADNEKLLRSLAESINQPHATREDRRDEFLATVALKGGGRVSLEPMKDAFMGLDNAHSGFKLGDDLYAAQYLEALYDFIQVVAGWVGGPIGLAADTVDVVRQSAEMWALSRYDGELLKSYWNLRLALGYGASKDPGLQARVRADFARMDATLPAERQAFHKALAASGTTTQDLVPGVFKNAAASDPFVTVAIGRGLAILAPTASTSRDTAPIAQPQATPSAPVTQPPTIGSLQLCYSYFRQCSESPPCGDGVCVAECEVAQDRCMGRAPSPQKLKYIAVSKAIRECGQRSLACFKGCKDNSCVMACSQATSACMADAEKAR